MILGRLRRGLGAGIDHALELSVAHGDVEGGARAREWVRGGAETERVGESDVSNFGDGASRLAAAAFNVTRARGRGWRGALRASRRG